ncbi:MAG: YkgJ family cysteine cluster protein [Planctomycetaceae bacterium]|nr:YkgJ family cysteine cluster protein [Planctomycetaceae bacterium]MCB9949735.1 YkgJ family cysteine cluster protein [Planctomycetaceae bacterium]
MSAPQDNQLPWYHEGLQFTCTQCGDCCTGSSGFVWVTEEDLRAIAEHLDKPIGEVRLMHTRPARGKLSLAEYANGDCIYLDPKTRGCTVYPVRPIQCRTWPFWKSNIATPAAWADTCRSCPGSGQGELIPLEEINERLSKTDI